MPSRPAWENSGALGESLIGIGIAGFDWRYQGTALGQTEYCSLHEGDGFPDRYFHGAEMTKAGIGGDPEANEKTLCSSTKTTWTSSIKKS
jgi:hypothetical protein